MPVQDVRDETGPDALYHVRPGLAPGEHRRIDRLNGYDLDRRLTLFEHFAYSGYCAAGANAGNEDVHGAVGIGPDLFGRGFPVDLRVGRVLELLGHEGAFCAFNNLAGLVNGAGHTLLGRRQYQLSPEEL